MLNNGRKTYNSSIAENSRVNQAVRGRTTKRPQRRADNDAPAHKHDGESRFEQGHRGVVRGLGRTKQRRDADGDQGKACGDEHVDLQHDEPFDLAIPDRPTGNTTIFKVCQCMNKRQGASEEKIKTYAS